MQMKRQAAEALASDSDSRDQRLPVWHEDEALLSYLECLGRSLANVERSRQEDQVTRGLTAANST